MPAQFQRPRYRSCEALGASGCLEDRQEDRTIWPDLCCCLESRPCREMRPDSWASCTQCPGLFKLWREQNQGIAEVSLLGLMLAPRVWLWSLALLGPMAPTGVMPCSLDAAPGPWMIWPRHWPFVLGMAVPQVTFAARLRLCAGDSFWWILGLVHSLIMAFAEEVILFFHLLREPQEISITVFRSLRQLLLTCLLLGTCHLLQKSLDAPMSVIVDVLLCVRSAFAALAPLRCFNQGRPLAAAAHCVLALGLVSASLPDRASWDWWTLVSMLVPGAALLLTALQALSLDGRPDSTGAILGPSVIIERNQYLESSVKELGKLTSTALEANPRVIFVRREGPSSPTRSERSGPPLPVGGRESGVDFGGMRRDWLGTLAQELFAPATGLVEHSTLGGGSYARLRPGGDVAQLEALGKVMGLALREGFPLGIDVCAPLAHLLAHHRLPHALRAITAFGARHGIFPQGVPPAATAAGPFDRLCCWTSPAQLERQGERELKRMGFSRDWLRWVSEAELEYWSNCLRNPNREKATAAVQATHAMTDAGAPVELDNLSHYMEARALRALVLDVPTELEAVWRGLRSIPRLHLPSVEEDVRATQPSASSAESEVPMDDAAMESPRSSPRGVRRGSAELEGELPPAKRRRLDSQTSGATGSVLQCLLSGDHDVPTAQWKELTRYTMPKGEPLNADAHRSIEWFWKYVEGLSPEERSKLLQWATGFRRLPPAGTRGFPPAQTKMTLHLVEGGGQRLPVANTCGLQIDLPRGYESEQKLHECMARASAHEYFYVA